LVFGFSISAPAAAGLDSISQRFLPIVKQATDRVGLAQQYNGLAGQGVALGLVKEDQASIESYVTRRRSSASTS